MRYYFQYLRTYLIIKRKQLLNKISLAKGYDYTAFVILCEPRSGSTLLHTYLNSHTQVLSYGEVLRMQLEKEPQSGVRDKLISDLVFKPHARQIKAVGLKLFYEYVDHPDYRDSFNQIVQRKDVKVIHLIRKNLLELYVSLKTAEQTNVWSTTQTSANTIQIKVDVDDYSKFIESHRQHQALFSDLFKDHTILKVS
jgi:LPS sulfotransferase NodH